MESASTESAGREGRRTDMVWQGSGWSRSWVGQNAWEGCCKKYGGGYVGTHIYIYISFKRKQLEAKLQRRTFHWDNIYDWTILSSKIDHDELKFMTDPRVVTRMEMKARQRDFMSIGNARSV